MAEKTTENISIIGGGSWATALIKMLLQRDAAITWYVRKQETVDYIRKYGHNPNYLTDVTLDTNKLTVTCSLPEALANSDTIVLAVPSAFLLSTIGDIDKASFNDKIVFSAIKGIVPEHNLIVGEYLNKILDVPLGNIGVITGPCHAEEVALEKLSYLTVACQDVGKAEAFAEELRCRFIKVTVSDDIYGSEYSAVLKNVVAVASGICHGLGYGDNFQAVLISNAIQEIKRFVDAVHPITRDINDSAYLGDLLVTAYSQFSRNRTFGNMVGKGYSVKSAQVEMNMVAEGYYAVKCIHEINKKHQVHMPICEAVHNILYQKISPRVEIKLLTDKLS